MAAVGLRSKVKAVGTASSSRALGHPLEEGPMSGVDAVKKPRAMTRFVLFKLFLSFAMGGEDGIRSLQKAFYGGQDALPDPTEGQKAPVLSIDPVLSLRRAWEGKTIPLRTFFSSAGGG